jgi:ferrous iron transport protein A
MNPTQSIKVLGDIQKGKQATVVDLGPGQGWTSRLTSLGLFPGVVVTMLQNSGHGPLIIRVRGTQIALGRDEAQIIQVKGGAA